MRSLFLLTLLGATCAFAQVSSNAKRLGGKPPCSASVTTSCVVMADSGGAVLPSALSGAKGNDTAYNATSWNGNTDAPTKNAVRDKIETLPQTVYSGTKALDTDAIASTACDTMTQSASGVASTDVVTWTFNADVTAVTGYAPVTTGGLSIYIWPTADTINIKVCNPTSSSITPGAVSLNLRVGR